MNFRIASAFSLLLLSGCASGVAGLRPLTYSEPAETRVLVSYESCKHMDSTGPQVGPIAAALFLGVASKALEGFGKALSEGAAGGPLPASVASANMEASSANPPKCIMIIRGKFAPPNGASVVTPDGKFAKFDGAKVVADSMPKLTELHHYIELQLIASKDLTAMTFAPVFTEIRKSVDGTEKKGSRELSIALAFSRPSLKEPVGGAVLIGDRMIGVGQEYKAHGGRYPFESPWFGGFLPEKSTAGAAGVNPFITGGTTGLTPVTVTATVIETRPTKEFLAFVATAFGAVKPAIEAKLKETIDPASLESASNSTFDAEAKFAEAHGKALTAALAYCDFADASPAKRSKRAELSGAARALQVAANKAAFAADMPAAFSSAALIKTSGAPVNDANAAACSALQG